MQNEGYQKVIDLIKGKIQWGVYKPGDKVLSERELAEKYNTSRMVVKDAIQFLVNGGYLKKIHGKGTFVIRTNKNKLQTRTGFTLDANKEDSTCYRVLSREIISGFIEMNDKLNLKNQDKLYRLQRVCLKNGDPLFYQDSFIPLCLFPEIEEEDFDVISPLDYMEHQGLTISNAPQSITIERVNEREAKYLDIPPKTEVLAFEYLHQDSQGRYVEYSKIYGLGEKTGVTFPS